MDDRYMLKLAQENIESDYQSGKISGPQYRKEMKIVWDYRRQLSELAIKETKP